MAYLKRGKQLFCLLAVVFLFVLSGCASIVSGPTQELTFQSEPEGATVSTNGRPLGKTPLTVQLDKKSDQTLTFELEGYKTITMPLTTTLDPWFWGNIVLGGFIGSTTDGLSGAVNEYAPSQYFVSLHPLNGIDKPQKAKAREFIIAGYKSIIDELNTKPGEYVKSLLELLQVQSADQESAIKKIKGLSEVYTDIPTFARQVTDLFIK